jgi:hypothetical protein
LAPLPVDWLGLLRDTPNTSVEFMNSMNYHGRMNKRNFFLVVRRLTGQPVAVVLTSNEGRYSAAMSGTRPRLRQSAWLVPVSTHDSLQGARTTLDTHHLFDEKLLIAHDAQAVIGTRRTDKTTRRTLLRHKRISRDLSRRSIPITSDPQKLTSEPDAVVRTNEDVYMLAYKTARLLGAKDAEVVSFLTTVFYKVTSGEFTPESLMGRPEAPAPASAADPLAEARARGRRAALEEYERPDNLALLDARDYAGRNDRTINEQRQKGELYALLPPGKTRGFRYPQWQFDAEPLRLVAALSPFVQAKANSWVIHSFMRRKRDELDGKSPAEVILDEGASVTPVVSLAMRDIAGEQGAA